MIPAHYPFLASRKPIRPAARLAGLLAALFLLPALAGCSMHKGLVGNWNGNETAGVATTTYSVSFRPDGTYTEEVTADTSDNSQPEKSVTYRGTFTADARHFTLNPKETVDNFEANSYSGGSATYGYKIKGNSLVIYGGSGPITLSRSLW